MDLYEAIEQEAMASVVEPDDEAWLRRVFRYYSKNFATPLHLVAQLPLEDVLRAFFEDVFESMSEEDREERIEWLLMTPQERRDHKDTAAVLGARDDAFLDNLNKAVAGGETISRPAGPAKPGALEAAASAPQGMEKLARMVQRTKERAAKLAGASLPAPRAPAAPPRGPRAPTPAPEPKQPETLGDLPEINVDFGRAGNLGGNAWADLDPLAPPRKKKT